MVALLIALLFAAASAHAKPTVPAVSLQTNLIRSFESQRSHRGFSLDADSAHSYDQISLSLDYRVEDAAVPLTGHAYLTIVGRQNIAEIPFNAEGITVEQVTIGGSPITYRVQNDTLYVTRSLQPPDTITFDIQVSVPARTGDLGFNYAVTHAYSFAEPWGARRWYPCFDEPFDKFNQITTAVNMPDYWSLASNGTLIETTYPSSGRKREVYHHAHPISTYLVMICAGNFSREFHTVNGVQYRYFAYPSDSTSASFDWARTPEMVGVFDSLFGTYPFENYGMVQAAIMNGWGAMEHQTFTTMGEHLVNGSRTYEGVVAHELSHQWFGDDLTCVDFRNIWLNEGFTTYCASLYYEVVSGEAVFQNLLMNSANYYYWEDQNYLRYAMYDPPDSVLFGSVEYDKGGWVLHMLRAQVLGDSVFLAGMRHYVTLHAGGTVNTEDFIQAMNDVSGQDLHWFFDQWVYHAGHPAIEYTIQRRTPTSRDVTLFVHQTQFNSATHTPYFRFPLSIDVHTADGGTTIRQFWFNAQEYQSVTETFASDVQTATMSAFQSLLFLGTPVVTPPAPTSGVNRFELGALYPNPFNSTTRIPFELARTGSAKIEIFDLMGRRVQTISVGTMAAGKHEIMYTAGPGMSSGVYLFVLDSGGNRKITKAMFLK